VAGALLVAHQYVLHVVLLEQGVVNVQHRPAWIPEEKFDPFVLQTLDNDFRATELHDLPPSKNELGRSQTPSPEIQPIRSKWLTKLLGLPFRVNSINRGRSLLCARFE